MRLTDTYSCYPENGADAAVHNDSCSYTAHSVHRQPTVVSLCSGLPVPDTGEQAQDGSLSFLHQPSCFNKYEGRSMPHCYPDLLANPGTP